MDLGSDHLSRWVLGKSTAASHRLRERGASSHVDGEVDRLLVSSSAHNSLAAITGVLLYDGDRFFQYFEGPPAGVQHTYDRIKRSSRHHLIAEVYNGSIVERYFPDWQMACRKVLPGSIVELSAQRWSRTRLALSSAGNKPEPVCRLLEFWEGHAAGS